MRRHKKNSKHVQIVVGLSVCLLLIMTVGYAAFSTNLNITAKGNIKNTNAARLLKKNVVNTGEGLYKDDYIENRFVFKGGTPNNYITFNDELWRIIAVESDDTLKIIREIKSTTPFIFDERTTETTGPRLNSNNTYCKLNSDGYYYGCNIWGSIDGTVTNGVYSGTVSQNSTLKTYLNNDYYSSLTAAAKEQIDNHEYKIKFIYWNTTGKSIRENLKLPFVSVGKSNVGMMNLDDFFKATANTSCNLDVTVSYLDGPYCTNGQCSQNCATQNFLYHSAAVLVMDPLFNYSSLIMYVGSSYVIGNNHAHYKNYSIKPVLYLKSDIQLNGTGTETDPYVIK